MGIPTYEYTTLKQILAETKVMLRLTDINTEDLFLRRVLVEGAQEMMTRLDFIEKTETLEICDLVAVLPCDFVKFDRRCPLVFTTNGQVDNALWCSSFYVTYTGGPFINCSPYPDLENCLVIPTINIQNGKIYFSNNIDATECTISYLAVNMDANGDMKIPRLNARPLIMYGCYMYNLSLGLPYQQYEKLWVNGKFDRRGQANMLDSFEKEQLSRTMNSLFPY